MSSVADLSAHYGALFREHGDAPLATQMSAEGQRFRFLKLLEIADLDGADVLDVGCGLADLYPYLRARYPRSRYTGVDVVPDMVECAAAKYPEAQFQVADLLSGTRVGRFDYVLLSAIFNNAIPDPTSFLEALIERSWDHAERGLGFNFLSSHHNFTDATMAYHDPARVFDFCVRRLSRRVRIEHHYERCDVAVFVYR